MASTTSTTTTPTPLTAGSRTPRQHFLDAYEREHATTMKVLRSLPADQAELRPGPMLRSARELAWTFALERELGRAIFANALASGRPGEFPKPPAAWDAVLTAIEQSHGEFRAAFETYTDEQLAEPVKFFGGPKTLADVPRLDVAWFLLHDQIHHRGQFSIYLRLAGARVPSIYGPSADEPWM